VQGFGANRGLGRAGPTVAGGAVNGTLETRLSALQAAGRAGRPLDGGRRGVEKESLRVTADGYIARTPHPRALGSALTHAFITTDFSEALLEFVTPPAESHWEVIQFLCDLHQFTHAAIGDELLWPLSMPCMIRSDADIPLARYGSSNVGTMKTVYRRGLSLRYGRYMQAIAGVHFNYSLPGDFWLTYRDVRAEGGGDDAFRSSEYLGMVRNVRRLDWLLLYLFGASPAVCASFLKGESRGLKVLGEGTLHAPFGTSLRMSDIGYQNTSQARLQVSANSLDEYIADLDHAVRTPSPHYRALGVRGDDTYLQLNANQLQIENEYYSTIRPKRVAFSGERPTVALRRGGVQYVELRALDVSPFDPVGINERQCRFLEVFLVYCLLADSPPIDSAEQADNSANHLAVARRGRDPALRLARRGGETGVAAWGEEVFEGLAAVAEACASDPAYREAVAEYRALLAEPDATPSGRLLGELRASGESLFSQAMQLSHRHANYFRSLAPELNRHRAVFETEASDSLRRQAEIEQADTLDFDTYLQRYFA